MKRLTGIIAVVLTIACFSIQRPADHLAYATSLYQNLWIEDGYRLYMQNKSVAPANPPTDFGVWYTINNEPHFRTSAGADYNLFDLDGGDAATVDGLEGASFAQVAGDDYTGPHNFGGASIEIENGTDPDTANEGEISMDTDGGSSANQAALRVNSDSKQKGQPLAREIPFTIVDPDDLSTGAARATKFARLWCNTTGYAFVIQEIFAEADADNHTFSLYETASRTNFSAAADSLIDQLVCAADGTSVFTDYETTISDGSVADGGCILYEYDSGATTRVSGTIKGYLDANVD